jgi:hypothetical protein
MKIERTSHGFAIVKFTDRYGVDCSLQKSSLAFEDAIWLGTSERMHLTQDMVRDLLPLLTRFVETGDIDA